ncbi:hypothetical protein NEUTE1DRAFT_113375 [Neurospora tetrasperma FGSC 2508]|uniref:Uncharacterized protein n=1 Tax=Neurospora tetrasperma (strain FGSC 2508 / ATCC MYA-4615 / P0657) TaxID=510951 RepID=F8MXU6_NEUT8|nr:uncharacterized protein NEUTE1DRAFT_113375 [Neurospora tetrasperma FGSC 2508]EGO53876.1 hypothetical protein NEUTE1DRAFT_113375 [Neurospora tetrasperma FGSC 2508]
MTFAELQRLNADLCPGSIVWFWVLPVESGSVGLWHVVSFQTSKSGACVYQHLPTAAYSNALGPDKKEVPLERFSVNDRVDDGNLTWPRRPYYGSRLEFAPARSRTVVLSDVQYQDQEYWHPIPEPHQHHEASSFEAMLLRGTGIDDRRQRQHNAKNPTPLILRASPTAPMPASRIRL